MSVGPTLAVPAALAPEWVGHINWAGHMDWDTGWRVAAMVAAIVFWLVVAAIAMLVARRAIGGGL